MIRPKSACIFFNPINYASQPMFHSYWTNEFQLFYNPDTGIDIDGAWIDVNEPSSVSSTFSHPHCTS